LRSLSKSFSGKMGEITMGLEILIGVACFPLLLLIAMHSSLLFLQHRPHLPQWHPLLLARAEKAPNWPGEISSQLRRWVK
jgi:hypothetical protein